MKLAACPSRDDLAAFVLGKLPDAAWRFIADHGGQCTHCQKLLHGLDAVSDPLILQIRNRRLQALAPELLSLLQKAEGIAVQAGTTTVPPGQTLHGNAAQPAQLTQEARQVLAPPQAADEIGRLGPYRVLKLLGQGGMGMVFLAEDPKLQRTVALKVMLPSVAVNATAKERFLREARATAAIEHDHIVAIHQVDEDRGMPFLAMQLLKGMSLEDYLKKAKETKKPVTLGQILKVGREMAKGLAVAHERDLIHRDIKPANVWLDATAGGRVKILDFGLARPAAADSTITQSGMIVGTPAYMAPEQATGQKIDGRADLFSLGVVLYRLCSGRLPWKGETAMGTLMAVATEEPPTVQELNPHIPPKLAALVMQLLAKKPEARPASAKAVVAAIQAIEREQAALQVKTATPVEAAPNQWQQLSQDDATAPYIQSPKRNRRRRWPMVAALLLAAGGLALLSPILIRIKNKDGSETVVQVPKGATITVEKDGKVIAQVPGGRGKGVDDAWIKTVQALPAREQVSAVAAKLKELNPGFDGAVTHKIENGTVTALKFSTEKVSNISPIRALAGLQDLDCLTPGTARNGILADLSPLKGMQLTRFNCYGTKVADLAPLAGMPLTVLSCAHTQVSDLSPLKGMPLTVLHCWSTLISDLSPLRGMKLESFNFNDTRVPDLSPLKDMEVKNLQFTTFNRWRDGEILRSAKVNFINTKRAAEFWQEFDEKRAAFDAWVKSVQALPPEKQVEAVAKKLVELNPEFDGQVTHKVENGVVTVLKFFTDKVSDISPVRALTNLKQLGCEGKVPQAKAGRLSDLWPLKGMSLTHLYCADTQVADLSPLRGSTLTNLDCNRTKVADLSPLKDTPVKALHCGGTAVSDLSPLKGMQVTHLGITAAPISDLSPLKDLPLEWLHCTFVPKRDTEILRSIKTLKMINLKPAAEFWKGVDGQKP